MVTGISPVMAGEFYADRPFGLLGGSDLGLCLLNALRVSDTVLPLWDAGCHCIDPDRFTLGVRLRMGRYL